MAQPAERRRRRRPYGDGSFQPSRSTASRAPSASFTTRSWNWRKSESRDAGATWELNRALWEHPTRGSWQPGGGGLCLHSIVPWPGEPDRLAVAISAAGVWLTEDGGATWRRGNEGLVPRYLPEDTPADEIGLCVHHLERAPKRPERMFMQFHGGVYRSDDAGATWTDIGDSRRTSASRWPSTHPTPTAPM